MESVMLEHYYVKPSTIDRIRNSWLGSQMDDYVGWMEANGYSSRTVFRRLPPLFCFAEFAQRRGCIDVTSALSLVDEFVSEWLVQHGARAKTSASLRKHATDIGNATRQMLRLASGAPVRHNRHHRPFPLKSEVPGFEEYLRSECGLMESTIHGYRHHLHEFAQYLRRAGIISLGDLSPALLACFIVECAPGMAPCTRRDLCCHLKVLLRFCHREGITDRDLRGAVGMPQVYRLADVPRSITWDEVRRTLEAVDRRTIRGRRDYAILLFLVTYGLRAHEVAKLTLEDIDWKRERFQVPERKAGHATAYPLAGVVAEALIDYLKRGRPETEDRHLFFRVVASRSPITPATVSSSVAFYLQKAEVKVRKGGSHTLRHTCVQRLIDAEFPLKTIGDYVGHRSPESTRIYTKVAIEALREVAMGDGEAL
jgi:integrase/recombinase XerD